MIHVTGGSGDSFDSERKLMSVICKTKAGDYFLFAKGAPEIILGKSNRILLNNRERNISYDDKEKLLTETREMSSRALRVMGFAYKKMNNMHYGRIILRMILFCWAIRYD